MGANTADFVRLTFARPSALLTVIIFHAVAGVVTETFTYGWALKVAFGRRWRMWFVLSAGPVEQLSLQIIQRVMPAANSGWSVITPVEESVTFKMAHSQGSLPAIRNVYYGLWSHPVSACVCGRECVFLHAHYSVSWRSVWVLKAIWLSDMNLHFPFLLLYKCPSGWCSLQLQLLKAAFQHSSCRFYRYFRVCSSQNNKFESLSECKPDHNHHKR